MTNTYAPKIVIILILIAVLSATAFAKVPGNLRIVTIDVGQADATLIMTGTADAVNKAILFDSGCVPGAEAEGIDAGKIISKVLASYDISHLDYYITSHYDNTAMGGVVSGTVHAGSSFIDDGIVIKNWVDRGDKNLTDKSGTYTKWLARRKTASKNGTVVTSLTKQSQIDEYKIDLGDGVEMICIAANGMVNGVKDVEMAVASPNALSLCFMVKSGDFEYLIGGDLVGRKTGKSEDAKIEDAVGTYCLNNNIKVDVLHVNNHGANSSSSNVFLQRINAKNAIISCGKDTKLKHPHPSALLRLAESNIERIYLTDEGTTDWSKLEGSELDQVKAKIIVADGNIVLDVFESDYQITGGEKVAFQ